MYDYAETDETGRETNVHHGLSWGELLSRLNALAPGERVIITYLEREQQREGN